MFLLISNPANASSLLERASIHVVEGEVNTSQNERFIRDSEVASPLNDYLVPHPDTGYSLIMGKGKLLARIRKNLIAKGGRYILSGFVKREHSPWKGRRETVLICCLRLRS